ncbi:hypothetical protein LINPERPRIM_LOCUS41187 [Linum perenne]
MKEFITGKANYFWSTITCLTEV